MDIKHKKRSTKNQIRVLVKFMSSNKELATKSYTGPLRVRKTEAQWARLKEILKNYGPDRTIEQWKQTWKDLKKHSRSENASKTVLCNTDSTDDGKSILNVSHRSQTAREVLDILDSVQSTGTDETSIESVKLTDTDDPSIESVKLTDSDDTNPYSANIELLIEKVKSTAYLWDSSHLSYIDTLKKNMAWIQIAKECGMKNGREAKSLWEQLQNTHQMMEFSLPNKNNQASLNDSQNSLAHEVSYIPKNFLEVSIINSNNKTSVSSLPIEERKQKKLTTETVISQQRKQRLEQKKCVMDQLRKKYDVELDSNIPFSSADSLSNLFTSLLQKTRELPRHLQLRVQREIFDSVTRAEEDALSASSYSHAAKNNMSRSFPDPLSVTKSSPTHSSSPDEESESS